MSDAGENESGFIAHLIELRTRLLYIVAGVAVVTLALMPFRNPIYTRLAEPLLQHLPEGGAMIAVGVVSPFLIPFKLIMLLAVVVTAPYALYHVWAFVAPGLYRNEKRLIVPLLLSSTLLFYVGMAFAYFVVFPIVFSFIMGMAPEGVSVTPDIASYLDTVVALFLAFGIAFEIPVATVLLVLTGVTTPADLGAKRPHVIVGAFVLGMLLTPPDIISQILLAVPMWALFEAGILAARLARRKVGDHDLGQADTDAKNDTER